MKWWRSVIATGPFLAVGLLGSWTWAYRAESGLSVAKGVAQYSAAQAGLRVQSGETPITFILRHKAELGLSADQVEDIGVIHAKLEGLRGELRSKIQKAIDQLLELVDADPVDLTKAEAKIREYAALETQLSIEKLRAVESAKAVLRPEQLARLKALPLDNGGKGIMGLGRQRGI